MTPGDRITDSGGGGSSSSSSERSYQHPDEENYHHHREGGETSSLDSEGNENNMQSATLTRRPGLLITAIRKAFSLDFGYYEPAHRGGGGIDDSEEDDGLIAQRGVAQTNRQWRMVGIMVLLFLLAASLFAGSSNNRRNRYDGRPSPSEDSNNPENTCAANDENAKLQEFSSIEGLENGAVATDHPECSKIGVSLLQAGGSAVDAAVGAAFCLGVANPASSGIGGGAFILIHSDPPDESSSAAMPPFVDAREKDSDSTLYSVSGKITEVVDAREVAPGGASTSMFDDQAEDASTFGGLAIAVPASLRGLELAHARHGKLPWADVVQPAIKLAREGVRVNKNLAHEIRLTAKALKDKEPDYGLRDLITWNNDWRAPYQEGDDMLQLKLAETLEAIAKEGSDALYSGERASKLAGDIQAAGGIVTEDDLANFRPTLRSPVAAHDISGYSVVGVPPPSSGGAAIIGAARFLSGYSSPLAATMDSLSLHRIVESLKHVFAIRMSLSDPAYNTASVKDAVADLVSGSYMEQLRKSTMDNSTLPLHMYGGSKWAQLSDSDGKGNASDSQEGDRRRLINKYGYLEDRGTSHLSVIDKNGNAVAMTTSINTYFGSKVVSSSTGLVLNNQMDDFGIPGVSDYFGLKPSEANFIKPGKKPLSSMSPTLVFQNIGGAGSRHSLGPVRLAIGASGGPKIISAVLQTLLLHVMTGLSLYNAIAHPRVHDQLIYHGSAVTGIEVAKTISETSIALSERSRQALERRNHELLDLDYTGTVQAVAVDTETGLLSAACDIRKGGSPDGY